MAQNIRKLIAQSSTQTMRTYQNVKCVIKRNKIIIIKSSSSADAKFINRLKKPFSISLNLERLLDKLNEDVIKKDS